LNILVEFIRASLAIKEAGRDLDPFSAEMKKEIHKRLRPEKEHHYWLNGYVKTLKDKNALMEDEDTYTIHPLLMPSGEGRITINLDWNI
jgi:folate-dependent phosphoribosylglycinamide formyltransferase PurN